MTPVDATSSSSAGGADRGRGRRSAIRRASRSAGRPGQRVGVAAVDHHRRGPCRAPRTSAARDSPTGAAATRLLGEHRRRRAGPVGHHEPEVEAALLLDAGRHPGEPEASHLGHWIHRRASSGRLGPRPRRPRCRGTSCTSCPSRTDTDRCGRPWADRAGRSSAFSAPSPPSAALPYGRRAGRARCARLGRRLVGARLACRRRRARPSGAAWPASAGISASSRWIWTRNSLRAMFDLDALHHLGEQLKPSFLYSFFGSFWP